MQEVGIGGEGAFAALILWNVNLMRFGPCDQRGSAGQIPFAPRGDHFDVRVERIGAKFEANLIIAFTRRAMGNRISAGASSERQNRSRTLRANPR